MPNFNISDKHKTKDHNKCIVVVLYTAYQASFHRLTSRDADAFLSTIQYNMNRLNRNYHHLSIETKTKIITMRNYSTATLSEIANQCDCSVSKKRIENFSIDLSIKNDKKTSVRFCFIKVSAVKYWCKQYQTDQNIIPRQRQSHSRALTEGQQNEIIRSIQHNPFLTAVFFARQYNVSDFTIRRVLLRNGIKCRKAARQTMFREEHKINRIAFCEVMLEWDDDRLNSIIFSDEKSFCSDVNWRSNVYRPFDTRYNPQYVKTERLSGRISACYWGAIGINGPVTDLIKINGRFDSHKYMHVLRNHVIPILRDTTQIFMQDNSPVHTAGRVMALLARQNFETLDWPPLSPDLNPIENVWSYMIRDWPLMQNRTDNALDELVQRRWNELRNNPGKSKISRLK